MGKFLIGVMVGALLLYGWHRHQPAAAPVALLAGSSDEQLASSVATAARVPGTRAKKLAQPEACPGVIAGADSTGFARDGVRFSAA